MKVANSLAYYTKAAITAVKSFIVQALDKAVKSQLRIHFPVSSYQFNQAAVYAQQGDIMAVLILTLLKTSLFIT